jgi:hypothetical protein
MPRLRVILKAMKARPLITVGECPWIRPDR